MWSEEWDNKFRDAAGQENNSANPEKGWELMEPLLDKHLPRKQRGFTLLLLLLISGLLGTAILLQSRSLQQEDKLTREPSHGATDKGKSATQSTALSTETTSSPAKQSNPSISTEPAREASHPAIPFNIDKPESVKDQPLRSLLLPTTTTNNRERVKAEEKGNQVLPNSGNDPINPEADIPSLKQSGLLTWPYGSLLKALQAPEQDNFTVSNTHLRSNPLKQEGRSRSRWSISLMGGSDISAARWRRAGEWRSAWGLALNYDLHPNWTLRAGLVRSRKIYTAGPDDYKVYDQFWTYASALNKVDANCLVYEIPVSLLYHFRNSGKGNWFASAGFASILMKEENYELDYKDLAGQQRYSSRSYSNYSNHFLGALQFSGGYRYPISKKFSVSAEPYIKIPVTGIGYGHVKLHGAGMLISVSYR